MQNSLLFKLGCLNQVSVIGFGAVGGHREDWDEARVRIYQKGLFY